MLRAVVVCVGVSLTLPVADALGASGRISVPDPGGQGRWLGSMQELGGGQACAHVTRTREPRTATRFCARLSPQSVYVYGAFYRKAHNPRTWRTALVVGFHPAVVRARLSVAGRTVRYRRGRGPRMLLAVVRGYVERGALSIDARRDGRIVTVTAAGQPGAIAKDPGGGAAWRAVAERGCVRWQRVPPRFAEVPAPKAGIPECWSAGRRVVESAADVVEQQDRTVVTGMAGGNVRSARVRSAAGEHPVALDRRTGALIAVLAGQLLAEDLELVATLDDGSEIVQRVGPTQ